MRKRIKLLEAEGKNTLLKVVRIFPRYRVQVFMKHEEGKTQLIHERKYFFKSNAYKWFLKLRCEFFFARALIVI